MHACERHVNARQTSKILCQNQSFKQQIASSIFMRRFTRFVSREHREIDRDIYWAKPPLIIAITLSTNRIYYIRFDGRRPWTMCGVCSYLHCCTRGQISGFAYPKIDTEDAFVKWAHCTQITGLCPFCTLQLMVNSGQTIEYGQTEK